MQKSSATVAAIGSLMHSMRRLAARIGRDEWQPPKHYSQLIETEEGENLFSLADMLAAGEIDESRADGKQMPGALVSIFDRIAIYENPKEKPTHFIPPCSLAMGVNSQNVGTNFPRYLPEITTEKTILPAQFDKILNEINDDPDHAEAAIENLISALQRHAFCIPAGIFGGWEDVSFYDHARISAALSVCLSGQKTNDISSLKEALEKQFAGTVDPQKGPYADEISQAEKQNLDQPIALLVGGDISGIQDFIYTISSKKAAQTLRGRSFYLQLLTEAALRYILRILQLPYSNVIYSGGGHFFLLAPLDCQEKISEAQKHITRILLKFHGIQLYLALAAAQVPAIGFCRGNFPRYWDEMHLALQRRKMQRFTELTTDELSGIFSPQLHEGNREKTCAICGLEEKDISPLDDEEEVNASLKKCFICDSLIKLGKDLPHHSFITFCLGEPVQTEKRTISDVLAAMGVEIQMHKPDIKQIQIECKRIKPEHAVLWAMEDCKRWPQVQRLPTSYWLRYIVNSTTNSTFNELIKESTGIERLGVLRMDVDGLGKIFKDGFKNQSTLTRSAALSFQLSIFFEGWVKYLSRQEMNDKGEEVIYAVYSGGDDLFLIGPWDRMPSLALQIEQDFEKFTCHNPDLHISAGIAFIPGKYPVYQAADDAFEMLKEAKDEPGKNSINFLNTICTWNRFESAEVRHETLEKIVSPQKAGGMEGSQALLQHLQNLAVLHKEKARTRRGQPVWGRWMWLGDYYLRRMAERAVKEKKEPLKLELSKIIDNLNNYQIADIEMWGLAARWAQLELRE